MEDTFFSQKYCDRCFGDLSKGRTMSMLNTDCICPSCKEKERNHPQYESARKTELEEVKKGNRNYKGLLG